MRYIKRCENCFHEVRFPLDKGVLLVTCPYCKYTFRVDPDDISTYREGRFDLTPIQTKNYEQPLFSFNSKERIKKVILFFLFSLLFLNIYKAFGGFTFTNTNHEKLKERPSPPNESEPVEKEDLEFI